MTLILKFSLTFHQLLKVKMNNQSPLIIRGKIGGNPWSQSATISLFWIFKAKTLLKKNGAIYRMINFKSKRIFIL